MRFGLGMVIMCDMAQIIDMMPYLKRRCLRADGERPPVQRTPLDAGLAAVAEAAAAGATFPEKVQLFHDTWREEMKTQREGSVSAIGKVGASPAYSQR